MDKVLEQRLASMSHADLLNLRASFPRNSLVQSLLAPFEHRAFARERAQEDPAKAWVIPLMEAGYQGSKLIGAQKARSGASLDQLTQTLKGTWEGYSK